MLLALDIGNSHIKIGVFCADQLQYVASIATDERQTREQYACMLQSVLALGKVDATQITDCILCSVVPAVTAIVQQALQLLWKDAPKMNVASGVKTGLNIRLDHPRALGSDLVANAVWALQSGKLPCVVVDVGTVTTFTAIDGIGALVGTAIAAGVRGTLQAAKQHAAQLPTVQMELPAHGVLGKNTVEALQSGAIYGAAAMVDGMVKRFAEALGAEPTVFLTGGTAEVIASHLQVAAILAPYSTLRGLQEIWKKNAGS